MTKSALYLQGLVVSVSKQSCEEQILTAEGSEFGCRQEGVGLEVLHIFDLVAHLLFKLRDA